LERADDTLALFIDVSQSHDLTRMRSGVLSVQFGLALAERLETLAAGPPTSVRKAIQLLRALAFGYNDEHARFRNQDDSSFVPGILQAPDRVEDSVAGSIENVETLLSALRDVGLHAIALFDGLDRMTDLAKFEQVVRQDVKQLAGIGVGVVLVGPLRALYGIDRTVLEIFDRFHYQPWLDVERDETAREVMTELLTRRIPSGAIDEQAVQSLVRHSGGVARDLLALAQSACIEAYVRGIDLVRPTEVDAAVDTFGRKHLQGLRPEELEVLQTVRRVRQFVHASESDLALLMTRRVLEYRDVVEQPRYVVHPSIERLLTAIADTP
jgi:hypothetical protein